MPRRAGLNERSVASVLFTDIGGSTELASNVGDKRWRQILKAHHELVRRELKRFSGREIDTAGDGFFALFDQPARAVGCAIAIVEGVERLGLTVRAGVHVGEVEPMGDGNVGGIGVHIGARVAAKANPGEIVVSSTVRDLMAGSDVGFTDRGVEALKGVPDEWRLFSVRRAEPVETAPLLPAEHAVTTRTRKAWLVPVAAVAVVAVAVAAFALTRRGSRGVFPPRANTLARLDVRTGKWLSAISVGQNATPNGVAADGDIAWTTSLENKTITAVRADGETSTIGVAGPPTGVAFGGNTLWVTTGFGQGEQEGSVLPYQLTTRGLQLQTPIAMRSGVKGIACDGRAVWVTNAVRGSVQWFGVDDPTPSAEINVGSDPEAIAYGGGAIWVANPIDASITKIDPMTHRVAATIAVPDAPPSAIAAGPGGVWIVSRLANKVVGFAPDGTRRSSVTVPAPKAVAVTSRGVWVGTASGLVKITDGGSAAPIHVDGSVQALTSVGDVLVVAVGSNA